MLRPRRIVVDVSPLFWLTSDGFSSVLTWLK
jgi:hypothetical protein